MNNVKVVNVVIIYDDGSGEIMEITQNCLQRSQIIASARRWCFLFEKITYKIYTSDGEQVTKSPLDKHPQNGG